jgi:hypothetical protein
MSDNNHRHETYDIYGTAATSGDVEQLESTARGLREDLSIAEERVRELETQFGDLCRRLWDHHHADGVVSEP